MRMDAVTGFFQSLTMIWAFAQGMDMPEKKKTETPVRMRAVPIIKDVLPPNHKYRKNVQTAHALDGHGHCWSGYVDDRHQRCSEWLAACTRRQETIAAAPATILDVAGAESVSKRSQLRQTEYAVSTAALSGPLDCPSASQPEVPSG